MGGETTFLLCRVLMRNPRRLRQLPVNSRTVVWYLASNFLVYLTGQVYRNTRALVHQGISVIDDVTFPTGFAFVADAWSTQTVPNGFPLFT